MRKVLVMALASMAASFVSAASASTDDRSYDGAVSCIALSKITSAKVDDDKTKAALKLMDAEVQKEIARGATREQADAAIEYSRYDYKDGWDQATIDAEWSKCLVRWTD